MALSLAGAARPIKPSPTPAASFAGRAYPRNIMKTITYYFSPQSPWTYLGHDRLMEIAKQQGASIVVRPCALNKAIFPVSGGLSLKQRPVQRVIYRSVELKRWSEYLQIPLILNPRYFPTDESIASLMIIAAEQRHGADAALQLTGAVLRGVWAQERDIADEATLIAIGNECGLDGASLYAGREQSLELYNHYTQEAIERKVFGAPWYIYENEPFWGQDRLDFLDRALAAGPRG